MRPNINLITLLYILKTVRKIMLKYVKNKQTSLQPLKGYTSENAYLQ